MTATDKWGQNMHLEELSAGLGVTFYVNIANAAQQLTFESRITEVNPKKHLVLVEAIIREDKVLSFKGKLGISVDLVVALPDEKPLLFQHITMETLKMPDDSFCYNIISDKDGIPYNRRNSFRCFIGTPTYIRSGKDMEEHEVILRDASASGFSITCDSTVTLEIGQLVHVLLEDYIEEINKNYSFHLYGMVVRSQELDNGKLVYGFKLNNKVGGLENYLTQKERIRIKKNRGK